MTEDDPTEKYRAEFDRIGRELTDKTYYAIGRCITEWSETEGFLVYIASMLLDTKSNKAGLVLYSINNFHTWLSIIEELFALDPQWSPLRPDWLEISKRLKKINDTRVALAHHALGQGKGFDHFVENSYDIFDLLPALKPSESDTRTKSKKHTPVGLAELTTFLAELGVVREGILKLVDRMTPIFLRPQQQLVTQVEQLQQQIQELTARRSERNS